MDPRRGQFWSWLNIFHRGMRSISSFASVKPKIRSPRTNSCLGACPKEAPLSKVCFFWNDLLGEGDVKMEPSRPPSWESRTHLNAVHAAGGAVRLSEIIVWEDKYNKSVGGRRGQENKPRRVCAKTTQTVQWAVIQSDWGWSEGLAGGLVGLFKPRVFLPRKSQLIKSRGVSGD